MISEQAFFSGIEKWKTVWREGIVPSLSKRHLEALLAALENDDESLLQGQTIRPAFFGDVLRDSEPTGGCLVGYACWKGEDISTVERVEHRFQQVCEDCDNFFSEPAACRYLLNWFDDTPRENMRLELIPEVRLALANLDVAILENAP